MLSTTLNGITCAFDDVGRGADALLLIHGHPFDRSLWDPQVAAFAGGGWRLVVPDLRGYGASTVVPGTTPFATFAGDLVALLDHLGLDAVVVGGLSMGGQIAMELCRLFPQRVRGLLLAATFPRAESAEGKRSRRRAAERLLAEGMEPYAAEVLPRMLAPRSVAALPAVTAHLLAMMRAAHPEGAAAALRARAERPPYEGVLAALELPALVVVGDADAFTTRGDAEEMRDLLGAELLWLPGIGHLPNLEAMEAFDAALARLLDRVEPRHGAAAALAAGAAGSGREAPREPPSER